MTLSTLSQELHVARSKRYALAGLVILGWEDAKYYVKAAEEINCPIILQVGPNLPRKHSYRNNGADVKKTCRRCIN